MFHLYAVNIVLYLRIFASAHRAQPACSNDQRPPPPQRNTKKTSEKVALSKNINHKEGLLISVWAALRI